MMTSWQMSFCIAITHSSILACCQDSNMYTAVQQHSDGSIK